LTANPARLVSLPLQSAKIPVLDLGRVAGYTTAPVLTALATYLASTAMIGRN